MPPVIQFCRLPDGARLAYAASGIGPPLLCIPGWVSHLELNWPRLEHSLTEVARLHRVIRYDKRGTGLSDRALAKPTLASMLADLEALVAHLGLTQHALYAASAGGPLAIAYAAAHPERVTELVLYGTFARGDGVTGKPRTTGALMSLARAEWTLAWTAFMDLYLPQAPAAEREAFAREQQQSAEPEVAATLLELAAATDVSHLLPRLTMPTLVAHARGDHAVPFDYGRELAGSIPGARFLPLEGDRHLLGGPMEQQFWTAALAFLERHRHEPAATPVTPEHPNEPLSDRERAVLQLLAQGNTNQQIAEQLSISASTVAHHVGSILGKIGAGNRTQAAAYAHQHGLLVHD